MKSDYDYSIKIVYNNFPWCNPTPEQKAKIEKNAQMILDARAVVEAYGFWGKLNTESECVAEFMKMYQKLTEKE